MCKNLVIFASGSGSNFLSIIHAIKSGDLSATISGLITDNPDAGAIEHARNHDIPVKILDVQNSDTFTSQIHQTLEKWKPDLIVLAGDRKSTRLNSSHVAISYAVFCLQQQTCASR